MKRRRTLRRGRSRCGFVRAGARSEVIRWPLRRRGGVQGVRWVLCTGADRRAFPRMALARFLGLSAAVRWCGIFGCSGAVSAARCGGKTGVGRALGPLDPAVTPAAWQRGRGTWCTPCVGFVCFPLRFSMFGMSLCITLAGLSASDGEHSLIAPASACAWVRSGLCVVDELVLGYSFLTASPPQQVEIVI